MNRKLTLDRFLSCSVTVLTVCGATAVLLSSQRVEANAFDSMQASVQQSRDMKTASITPHPGGHLRVF